MKKITAILLAILSLGAMAQTATTQQKSGPLTRKFQMLVELDKQPAITERNRDMKIAADKARAQAIVSGTEGGEKSVSFLKMLSTGFGTALVQKTQNATSNLLSVGVNYLVEAMKSDSHKWYAAAQSHCSLPRKLRSETTIKDFYAAPSQLGAMDPQNIQFKGFGCHHYLEEKDNPNVGQEVFYIFCSMRRDSVGISSIVNHSKFLIEVDSLYFNPRYCGLPNDSLETLTPYDFAKRTDLTLTIRTRIYSSWINEAIMVTNDQQLGEFTITARIDPSVLNEDSIFIYRKGDRRFDRLVNVVGDSFIVPRSFTGTADGTTYSSTWGTGQYRLEMDVNETCRIIDSYYYKQKYLDEDLTIRPSGNGQQIAYASIPDLKKFDKSKWKVEWTPIKNRKRRTPIWTSAWRGIVTAYKGTGWVQTFTDPMTNVILNYEGQKLNDWLDITSTSTSMSSLLEAAAAAAAMKATGTTGAKPAAKP